MRQDPKPDLRDVLEALERADCKPRKHGKGYQALCPAHEDKSPSLSISEGSRAPVLIKCFAGCTFEQVMTALGFDRRPAAKTQVPLNRGRPRAKKGFSPGPAASPRRRGRGDLLLPQTPRGRHTLPWFGAKVRNSRSGPMTQATSGAIRRPRSGPSTGCPN